MRTRLMNLLIRWIAFPLLIVLINTVAIGAQGSFLDELRIKRQPESFGERNVRQGFSNATGVPHDAGEAESSLNSDRLDAATLESDPQSDKSFALNGLPEDSLIGDAMLDDAAAVAVLSARRAIEVGDPRGAVDALDGLSAERLTAFKAWRLQALRRAELDERLDLLNARLAVSSPSNEG